MEKYSIVLGSASPRRKEILGQIVPRFEVRLAQVDEQCRLTNPAQYVMYTAGKKAAAIGIATGELLICADTIVCFDRAFLGKPIDDRDAKRMLMAQNGKINTVYTGVCLRTTDRVDFFCEASEVRIDMSEAEIDEYIACGLARDKAGAYGIQDAKMRATLLSGSLSNVIGLPKEALAERLAHWA